MAPAENQLSTPGAATYNSDHMHVGDGTWDFTKNTFLLPNLQGLNFDTMRINGMGNRFSTVQQYHTLILAHGILMAAVFMFLLPTSVMLARFYSREPGYAVRYHAQLNIFSAVLLVAAFILPFFAVGNPRSLTNPHHGIGVATFVLFLVQILGGSFVRYITKIRSLRIMIHQWLGRTTALLGIVQIPLGLTLYGSPKSLFVLYALWMGFLFVVYFVLCYQSESRREIYMSGPRSEMRSEVRSEVRSDLRSEDGRTRMTESEYFSEHDENHHSKLKWLGPLAAAAGLFALLKSRRKNRDGDTYNRSRSRSRSRSPSRRPTELSSRPPSGYYGGEKYSDMPHDRSERGGGGGAWTRILATLGLARLFSGFRRNNDRDDVYSAVSTETPYRQRSERATTISEFNSEYTDDASTIPPSHHPAGTAAMSVDMESRNPRQTMRGMDDPPRRGFPDESEYSSYVSPSRRQPQPGPSSGNGFAQGILSGLGLGWVSRRISDRRARREEERMQDEDDYRSVTEYQRQTREGSSPPRRGSQRRQPSGRRYTATGTETALSEITESSFVSRPHDRSGRPTTPSDLESTIPASTAPPSRARNEPEQSHGTARSEVTDATSRPDRRESSRRRRQSERAAAQAAARASSLAAAQRDQFGSPTSQPVSVQLDIHGDKDRNLTLRRLTEDEIAAAKERGDSEMSSILDSPTHGRRYRRDSSQRRAENAAERRAEGDEDETPLSPPHPSFAKGGRRNRDSSYFAGGPSNLAPPTAVSMVSSVGSHGTWSGMSMSPSQPMSTTKAAADSAAADNRRRRRQERRRTSSSRPSVD